MNLQFVALFVIALLATCEAACPTVSPNDLDVPGIKPLATLKAAGTRNFTCVDNKPDPASATVAARFVGNGVTTQQKWDGLILYDAGNNKYFNVTTSTTVGDKGKRTIVLNNVADPPVTLPSPTNSSWMPWARFSVKSDDGKNKIDYVRMIDTINGTIPATCNGSRIVSSPYAATYNLYSCSVPNGIEVVNITSGAVREACYGRHIVGLTFGGVLAALFA